MRAGAGASGLAMRMVAALLSLLTAATAVTASQRNDSARHFQSRGYEYYLQEDFASALLWFERAHALFVDSLAPDDHASGTLAAEISNDFAELLRLDGQTDRAEQVLREAVRLAAAHARHEHLHAVTLNNLAGVYKDRAQYTRAEPLLVEALRITRALETGPSERLATAHLNLAEVYRLQDRHDFAEPHYRSALEFARALWGEEDAELVYFLGQMAVLRSEQSARDDALALRAEGLAILERAPHSSRFLAAELQRAMGEDLLATGRVDEAIALFERSVRGTEVLFGPEHWITSQGRLGLARALARRDARGREEALAQLDAAIATSGASAPEVLVTALGARATLRREQGRLREAIDDLDRGIESVESLRQVRGGGERSRAMLVGENIELYHQMIALRIEQGEVEQAYGYLQRMRARTLIEEIERNEVDLRADLPVALRDSFEAHERTILARLALHQDAVRSLPYQGDDPELRRRLREHQVGLDQAVLALRDLQEAMHQRSPRWRAILATSRDCAGVPEAQALLGPHGVLLEYAIGATRSFVFEIPPAGASIRVHELTVGASGRSLEVEPGAFTREVAEQVVRSARRLLRCFAPLCESARDRTLRAVADLVVPADLREQLRRSDLVIVAADGALDQLPFEALIFGERADGSPRTWLAEAGPTLYTGSATALRDLRARHAARSANVTFDLAVLSVSDPDFVRATTDRETSSQTDAVELPLERVTLQPIGAERPLDLPPLPATRLESAAIVEAFAGQPVVVLQDSLACERAVREFAPRARLLHLATHGFAQWNGSYALAALVLSAPDSIRDASDDGLLQTFEIDGLTLGAELAVLSACETAIGEHIEGEGAFALSRAFLTAGAARVIATLWPVADEATAELVSSVFRGITLDDGTPMHGVARQLRNAKLAAAMDPRTRAPFYWAPFVLTGVD